MPNVSGRGDAEIALAVIGTLVPDEARFHGPAFNRAGQMFQKEFARALAHAGLKPSAIFGIEPVPAFPHTRRLLVRGAQLELGDGLRVRLLPFLNVQPLKPVTAGLSVIVALIAWGWRHRRQPRIVHCINLTMPPGLAVLVGARLIGAKATVSVLDIFRPGGIVPDRFYWRVDYWLQRHLIPKFDGHAVVSEAIVEDFLPGRRVCRIEGGIRPDDFGAETRPEAPTTPSLFRAVLAGTLDVHNGVELALDAFSRLPQDGYELVVAGSGAMARVVEERASIDSRIVFRGFLSFDEVLALYRSADVLLNLRVTRAMDTRYFFPSKMMECMASGTPVLSTLTGHVEEEFGDFVYLLRDESPAALAALLTRIAGLTEHERAEMGRRAKAYMFAHKTWDRQGEKMAGYLRSVVLGDTRDATLRSWR
ncbi:MAG: glycosyltransferase [Vicinamibacterales bacterium]